MIKLEHAVVIGRPIAEVFAFTTNVRNWTQTNPSNQEVHLASAGPFGEGSTFRVLTRVMGRLSETRFEVTEYAPDRTFGVRTVSGPVRFRGRYVFDAVAGGTQVQFAMEMALPRLLRWLRPVITRMQRKQLESDQQNLKRLLEEGQG